MAKERHTITTRGSAVLGGRERLRPALFLLLECDRPRSGGARYSLAGLDQVSVGGKDEEGARSFTIGDSRTLGIRVPDRRMSSVHARLQRSFGKWVLTDAGSKNGTVLNGTRIESATLQDGDLIELGHTMFRYREAVLSAEEPRVVDSAVGVGRLVTLLPGVLEQFERVAKVARSRVPVLVTGESGTGKEVVARAIHELSGRHGSFTAVNCGALPPDLVESQLFGHEKGAFSGAVEEREGYVRASDGGTLLLDEIGDLPLRAQAALLRVLQEREVIPVGGTRPVAVDVRTVAATHRDLGALVAERSFREDLYARICGVQVDLPPLRERVEDIGDLIAALLRREIAFTREAARAILSYGWPLNIRELVQCLDGASALAEGSLIALHHLPAAVRQAHPPSTQPDPAELCQEDAALRARLVELLAEHRGNVSAVARELGKARQQVHRWINRLAIDMAGFRDGE